MLVASSARFPCKYLPAGLSVKFCILYVDFDLNTELLCLLHRYSPSLLGVKVLEHRNVRRAKLYYLRDRKPSEYRVQ